MLLDSGVPVEFRLPFLVTLLAFRFPLGDFSPVSPSLCSSVVTQSLYGSMMLGALNFDFRRDSTRLPFRFMLLIKTLVGLGTRDSS